MDDSIHTEEGEGRGFGDTCNSRRQGGVTAPVTAIDAEVNRVPYSNRYKTIGGASQLRYCLRVVGGESMRL